MQIIAREARIEGLYSLDSSIRICFTSTGVCTVRIWLAQLELYVAGQGVYISVEVCVWGGGVARSSSSFHAMHTIS
jgi:hypothetical protein